MTSIANRVAIVTGSSRGIGAAVARRLASDGLLVIVNYTGGAKAAAEVVRLIEKAGGRATSCQADISDPQAVKRLFASAEETYGGVDVLVNNAGIMELAPLAEFDDAAFDSTIAINLKGTFNCLREAAMRLRHGGRIVNFSSSVVGLCEPTYGVYAATKAAVEALTHILAKELGPRCITVNAVAPGPVATELFLKGKDQATVDRIKQVNPLRRLGEVDDVARVVSLLVGPDSAWINGQIIRANGGVV